jgi:hypothetical protein
MRFFELSTPEANNTVSTLVDIVKNPDVDNKLKQEILNIFKELENKADQEETPPEEQVATEGVPTGDVVSSIENDEDYFQKLLNSDPRLKAIAEKKIKEAQSQGFNSGVALSRQTRAGKVDKANQLAKRVGKGEDWARDLISRLDLYDNDELINLFLDSCNDGTALSKPIVVDNPQSKVNLRNAINPKLIGILDNKQAFSKLAVMPFSDQTAGYGGGVGPGESLFAMLIPNAKKAPSSDLLIGDKVWEVKAGGSDTSKAWLDSSPGVSPAELKREFIDSISETVKPKLRKKYRYKDDSVYTLSEIVSLADFRDGTFKHLRTVFNLLEKRTKVKTLDAIYSKLFGDIKKKEPELYKDFLIKSLVSIESGNRKELANTQAKLGMIQYAVGSYQAENMLIYNYNTQDVVTMRGIEGIIQSIDNPANLVRTETITMGSSKKPSAGISLASKAPVRKPKIYD